LRATADKIIDTSKSAFTFKASVSKLEIIFPNDISVAKTVFSKYRKLRATV
ncbi:hypothetical protein DBR06_SOUSAS12510040, partial [Sousa chinensis]